jgi:hypothetical protein
MTPRHYYHPVARGLEQRIAERLAYLRGLSRKASMPSREETDDDKRG